MTTTFTNLRRTFIKISMLVGLVVASCMTTLGAGAATPATSRTDLERSAINAAIAHRRTPASESVTLAQSAHVDVKRIDPSLSWAFGAVVIPAWTEQTMPEGWLFIARQTPRGWQIALEGTSKFSGWAWQAPAQIVADHEKQVFAATSDPGVQAINTGLRLPWALGQSWTWLKMGTNSLNFTGGDQVVRAAGSGNIYTMCSNNLGWLRIVHSNGYTTDYYHLWNNIKPADGSAISEGARLGDTGTDISCGGTAVSTRQVLFTVRSSDGTSLNDKTIGGWTFYQGSLPYAIHNTTRVNVGGQLYNYGR